MANPLHSQIWKKNTGHRRKGEKKGLKIARFRPKLQKKSTFLFDLLPNLAKDDCPMPTLPPHKIEKENPAQKWGNSGAKSERAVGSNLIIYSDLSRRSRPQPLPRQPSLARSPTLNYMIQPPTSTSLRTAWSIVDIITNLVKNCHVRHIKGR